MGKVPLKLHLINFTTKYILFLLIFLAFRYLDFMEIELIHAIIIPFIFTLIGIIADWLIVPIFHNIPSSLMGATFMGSFTYILLNWLELGHISLGYTILLAVALGIVEATLHRLFVKPHLENIKG